MSKATIAKSDKESSFVQLLSEADEIRIREVPAPAKSIVYSSVDKVLEDFEKGPDQADYRSFVVQVKKNRPAPSAEGPKAAPIPQSREQLLENARVLFQNTELLLARHIYSYLLRENIRDQEALQGLGLCLLKLGDNAAAKKCFRAVWELYQKEEAALYLARCQSNEGEETAALELLKTISGAESQAKLSAELKFDFHKLLGNVETRLGHYDEAFRHYQFALALQPVSDVVYVNLGTLELQKNSPESAKNYFSRAREINPSNAKAYCGLGLSLMATQEFDAAKERFLETLSKDPFHVVALAQLFCLAQATDDHTFLRPPLLKFLESHPRHVDARYWLAACLYRERKWTECEREVDRVLELNRSHFQAQKLKESLTQNKHQG